MVHLSSSCRYFLYLGATDMRKGFDSLCGIVTSGLKLDALSGSIFIFMNRRRNQLKLLLWEGDGFSLYYKRLEKGTFEMPKCATDQSACLRVTAQQLQFVLQGVSLQKVHLRKRYKKVA